MTNAILRGKPDAGNPHVRFDVGEVASEKPRRGSLLYKAYVKSILAGLTIVMTAHCTVQAEEWKNLAKGLPGVRWDASTVGRIEITQSGWYRMTNNFVQIVCPPQSKESGEDVVIRLDMNGYSVTNNVARRLILVSDSSADDDHTVTLYVTNSVAERSYIDGAGWFWNSPLGGRGMWIGKKGRVYLNGRITISRCFSRGPGAAIHNFGVLHIDDDLVYIGGSASGRKIPMATLEDNATENELAKIGGLSGDLSNVSLGMYGGGVYNDGSSAEFYMTGGLVQYNACCHWGGGICNQHDVKECVLGGGKRQVRIEHNIAPCGGGVETGTGSHVILSNNVTIAFNRATGKNEGDEGTGCNGGGGLAVGLAPGDIVKTNELIMCGGTIVSNRAETGGGVYMRGARISGETVTGWGYITILGGRIADNVAEKDGGGVYTKGPVYFYGGTIEGNCATNGNGGGVYVSDESENADKAFRVTTGKIAGNKASNLGGGIYAGQTVEISGGIISNNTAQVSGGGVAVDSSEYPFKLTGGEVVDNVAGWHGGGFYILSTNETPREVSISGGITRGNLAKQQGGGFSVLGGTLVIKGGQVTNNRSERSGGGFFTQDCSNLMVTGDVSVAYNTAGLGGGGFYVREGNVTIDGGEVCYNVATNNGGAFHVTNCVLTVHGGKVLGNHAGKNGGGFYANYCNRLVLTGSVEVAENAAKENGGGFAVLRAADTSILQLNGGEVRGNVAGGNGGGFWLSGRGNLDDNGSKSAISGEMLVYENRARNGGGFYMENAAYLKILGGVVYLNVAESEVDASLKTALADGQLDRSKVKGCGGGFYLAAGTSSGNRTRLDFVEKTRQIGIYLNVASNAADDVLAEGNNLTRISYLPTVDRMVLDYAGGALSSGWYEDYFKDETEYDEGTAVKKAEWEKKEYQVERYRAAGDNVVKADEALDKLAENGLYTKYACLTLGFLFPIPAQIWITDHEDVGNGVMNLQFEPIFTNKYAQTEFIPRWAEMAVEGKNLYAAWADKQSDIEKYIDEPHEPGEETTHTRLVRLRDNNKETACKNGRIWITLPLRDHQEEKDGSKPLLGTTSRYYRLFVEKIEDVNQEASN